MVTLLYLLGGIFVAGTVWLARATFRERRQAQANYEKIQWILKQLERALEQIESDDEDEILAGLQVIVALPEPEIRLRALSRLNELAQSSNPRVSHCATVAINKLISTPDKTSPPGGGGE